MDENIITPMSQAGFVTGEPRQPIIKVVGVGGGGSNAVSHMYNQGIENVSFVILNTDRQALNHSPVPTKVEIGDGLGAGNKPEKARVFAEEAAERISEIFDPHTKMVFITAGMGGGTGTGAAPVVARLAQEKGLLTIGIVTIPFLFEGPKKILKATEGAEEMSKYVDALLIINNQRLNEIYPDLNFMNAFGKADDTLTTAARSISELINTNGEINLDFNDVETTLRKGGAAIISSGYGEGDHRVTKAIHDALDSPLLRNRDIMTSKKLLFNVYFDPDAEQEFSMSETDEITSFISTIDSDVDVIWGAAHDHTLGNKVKFTILAAGFDVTIDSGKERPKKVVTFGPQDGAQKEKKAEEIVKAQYGKDAVIRMQSDKSKALYIVLQPSQIDNDEFIDAFEKSPAFNRDKKNADEIKAIGVDNNPAPQQPKPTTSTPSSDTPRHNSITF